MKTVNVYYSDRDKGRELIIAVLNIHQHIPIEELHGYIADIHHPNTESYIAMVDNPEDNNPDAIKTIMESVLEYNRSMSPITGLYTDQCHTHNHIEYSIYFHKVI